MGQTNQIMNDINDRETNLNNIYNTELKNLQTQLDTNIQSISQWFSEQQNNLSLQKGEAARQRSQQALDYAISQLQTVQQEAANRRSALDSWAMSNSDNINQLKQNMLAVASPGYNLPQQVPIVGTPVTDAGSNLRQSAVYGGGGSVASDEKQNILSQYNPASPDYWLRR